ncbi:SIR2 family protein [Bacteroidota bacterium]
MVKFGMTDIKDWKNDKLLFKYLSDNLIRGRISLVIGSGVSKYFGLPTWQELIDKLYALKKQTPNTYISKEMQVEYFRESLCENDQDYFLAIQDGLYSKAELDFESLKNLSTLSAIGSLVMASKRGSASNVISFNFDNILELFLKYSGFVTNSRYQTNHWADNSDVDIYHPHGFIPAPPIKQFSDDIVFDLISYSKTIGDESNPWRQHVISIMRTHFCIFIGLSGDDNNLDSLLTRCHETHIAKEEGVLFWGLVFKKNVSKEDKIHWNNRGIFIKEIKLDYEEQIPKELFRICQGAANNR